MLQIPFLDNALRLIAPIVYDDVIDRLNYYFTSVMLLFFCIMVSAKQYVGSPIQCWVPAQFRGGWEQYTEDYCFIQNTYFNPLNQPIPDSLPERREKEIGYYQWVPIVLACQAFMFFLPNAMWKIFCWQSGINVKAILKGATECTSFTPADRETSLTKLARFIEDSLCIQRDAGSQGCRGGVLCVKCVKKTGGYLNSLYLLTKVMYFVNIVGQFYILNAFLGTDYSFWGIQILNDLVHGREWDESTHFPRVTMCDFDVRELGNTHHHTVQCVLMINMFNEKIYLFIWFWFFVVGVCTGFNLVYWLLTSIPRSARESAIQRYLRITHNFSDSGGDRRTLQRFVHGALRPDGVLLLRFISGHAGDLVSTDLTGILWKDYASKLVTQHRSRAPMQMQHCATAPVHLDEVDECRKMNPTDMRNGSNSDKSTDGSDHGFSETLYDPKNACNGGMQHLTSAAAPLLPNTPSSGYPGPPALPPKPKVF